MKQKKITKWAQGISTGILAAALSLMVGTVNTQAEPVKEGENCVIPLAKEVKLDMVWIKPGTFMMGSPKDELGRFDNETQHEVTLTKGYWLGKYEVTQEQYKAIMGKNPSEFVGDNLPVEQVSWDEAMEFCKKLTEVEKESGRLPSGYEYTLPTEAQWEYACRARTTTAFNNGTNIPTEDQRWKEPCPNLDPLAWYWYNSNSTTHPVGQKRPNNWGIYDMHGNVWEWCLDWCPGGSSRVVRGGSWDDYAHAVSCRSANRIDRDPSYNGSNIGFRVALVPVK